MRLSDGRCRWPRQSPAMSMIGEYLRVTAAELDRAIHDPDRAQDFVEEVQDVEEGSEPAPAEARHFSTYKTWDMLRFLLAQAEIGVLATTTPVTGPGAARVDAMRKLRRALDLRDTNTAETHVFEIPTGSLNRRSSHTTIRETL